MITTGSKIKYYRNKFGLTQTELADQVGCQQRQISEFENDQLESRELLIRVADFFNAPDILATALRGSVLMHRYLEMMGHKLAPTEIDSLIAAVQVELDELSNQLADGLHHDKIREHSMRLAEMTHLLQALLVLSYTD